MHFGDLSLFMGSLVVGWTVGRRKKIFRRCCLSWMTRALFSNHLVGVGEECNSIFGPHGRLCLQTGGPREILRVFWGLRGMDKFWFKIFRSLIIAFFYCCYVLKLYRMSNLFFLSVFTVFFFWNYKYRLTSLIQTRLQIITDRPNPVPAVIYFENTKGMTSMVQKFMIKNSDFAIWFPWGILLSYFYVYIQLLQTSSLCWFFTNIENEFKLFIKSNVE